MPAGWYGKGGTRERILKRDPVCTLRTHCWGAPSTEVDHGDGGPDDHSDENLRGACHDCHASRTGQQGAAVSHARSPKRKRQPAPHPSSMIIDPHSA